VRRCAECSGRRLAFAHARAAVEYDEPVRRIVAAWKERGLRRLAAWAATVVAEAIPRPDVACLAYVPGDPERFLQRGHHAAERLARGLGEIWQLPVESPLARAGGSSRQRGLSLAERRRNVASVFRSTGRSPACVALVDDVYTTGATVNVAASALRRTGATRVEVVTFARAMRRS
jgi:predicted amidophosphoribosyltransferase